MTDSIDDFGRLHSDHTGSNSLKIRVEHTGERPFERTDGIPTLGNAPTHHNVAVKWDSIGITDVGDPEHRTPNTLTVTLANESKLVQDYGPDGKPLDTFKIIGRDGAEIPLDKFKPFQLNDFKQILAHSLADYQRAVKDHTFEIHTANATFPIGDPRLTAQGRTVAAQTGKDLALILKSHPGLDVSLLVNAAADPLPFPGGRRRSDQLNAELAANRGENFLDELAIQAQRTGVDLGKVSVGGNAEINQKDRKAGATILIGTNIPQTPH